jgi:hypothetical protein
LWKINTADVELALDALRESNLANVFDPFVPFVLEENLTDA